MNNKKVIIVNPHMGRHELYSELCEKLQERLINEGIEISISNGVGSFFSEYAIVVFASKRMFDDAKNAKKMFPNKMIILWGINIQKENENKGVVTVKMDDGIDEIVKIIKFELTNGVGLCRSF